MAGSDVAKVLSQLSKTVKDLKLFPWLAQKAVEITRSQLLKINTAFTEKKTLEELGKLTSDINKPLFPKTVIGINK